MPNRINIKGEVEFLPEGRPLVKTGELEMDFQPDAKVYAQGIQTVSSSAEETLNVGDVSNLGFIVIVNRDDTNYVEVGLTAQYTIKLKPGQFCMFPPAGTIYVLANSADVDVEYYVFPEDT